MTFLGEFAAGITRPLSRATRALTLVALVVSGCDRKPASTASAPAPAGEAGMLPELLLFCGAGIRPPVEELAQRFQTSHRAKIALDFAGSQVLFAKLKLSGRGDLYIPGDKEYMDQAAGENLILSQQPLCCFVPTILVQKGNPRKIQGIADLLQPGLRLGLGNAEACAIGRISKRIFARNNIAWDRVERNLTFQSMTVNELGLQIQSGALDAVMVWDAIARYFQDHGTEVPIPPGQNIISTVSVGVLASTRHRSWAERFVAFAASAEGQAVFRKHHYSVCPAPELEGRGLPLTAEQATRLGEALAPLHERYDPEEQMIRRPFSSPGYHTTLQGGLVHPTRDSLHYAVALLDSGEEGWHERAEAILRRVIGLQDQDAESRTYGIWPWFLEEPLSQMSPPDWNWADFCGTALLQVALDHRERLSLEVRRLVEEAIRHAARSIQRRNVGPGYTNIAIMGTYVTLVAGQLYAWLDLQDYGLARLRRFYDYTMENGAFREYNSPTYTVVALEELGRMRQHVRHAEAAPLIETLYRLAWEEIAQHFHPPTRQWAGPHSRCYSTLLRENVLGLIHRSTDGRVPFGLGQPGWCEQRLRLPCPQDLESFFTRLERPRELVKTFARSQPALVGTTYLHPAFALGTINQGDTWNQRRALVAYWGTTDKPAYLHLRLLHDGYDFAAGQFFSVQRAGTALAGIALATDGGDRHVSLDPLKNATLQARDLRLRFEFGGAAAAAELAVPAQLEGSTLLRFGSVHLSLAVPYARFGEASGRWEAGRTNEVAWLDRVLYHGPEQTFRLDQLEQAAVGLAVRFSVSEAQIPTVTVAQNQGQVRMDWNGLSLSFPVKPASVRQLQSVFRAAMPPSS